LYLIFLLGGDRAGD